MRIGLNLLHAMPEIGGGWNYIANLINALGAYDHENTYFAFVTKASECLVPHKTNFKAVPMNIRATSRAKRVLYENTALQALAYQYQIDCMHWFANTQGIVNLAPGVVTVYDAQSLLNFTKYSLRKRLYLRMMMNWTGKLAKMLLPMSDATAQTLQQLLHIEATRMTVIPAIVSASFRPAADEQIAVIKRQYGLPDKFWLYVAHLYAHKNHLRLLEAYHQLKQQNFPVWPLVLRGDTQKAENQVKLAVTQLGLEEDIIFLPRLKESELCALYSAATALIFPSLYEGGGIPVVEALACGCPVVASRIPAVQEYAGDAAHYFDPLDSQSIATAIANFQAGNLDYVTKQHLGLTQVNNFRPDMVAHRLVTAYTRAIEN